MFQCSSASRKFLNRRPAPGALRGSAVSVLFSEPKIPQLRAYHTLNDAAYVSVLFSEPKIPQSPAAGGARVIRCGFSALQRAENSSMVRCAAQRTGRAVFQCSSASRKFLNERQRESSLSDAVVSVLFSEPKIPQLFGTFWTSRVTVMFQCSSASRKFLNLARLPQMLFPPAGFQCSSASRKFLNSMLYDATRQ